MADTTTEIRRAVDTGDVLFGVRETEKSLLKGKGELIIISRNCPIRTAEKLRHYSSVFAIPFFEFSGSALELGSVCGKPFVVSTLLVLNPGKSKVTTIMEQPKPTNAKTKAKTTTKKPHKEITKKTAKKPVAKAKVKAHKSAIQSAKPKAKTPQTKAAKPKNKKR